jgi:hypothetical protein
VELGEGEKTARRHRLSGAAGVERLLASESPKWTGVTRGKLWGAFGDLALVHSPRDWKNTGWLRKAQAAYKIARDEWTASPWSTPAFEALLYNAATAHLASAASANLDMPRA